MGDESYELRRDPGAWLEGNAGAVSHVARRVARHRGLHAEASAALESGMLARLAADDYQVLRRYSGEADIETYLAVVATRVLLDQCSPRTPSNTAAADLV